MEEIKELLESNNRMLKAICDHFGINVENPNESNTKPCYRGDKLKQEVARMTELGVSKRNIADALGVSVSTVSIYRRQINLDKESEDKEAV